MEATKYHWLFVYYELRGLLTAYEFKWKDVIRRNSLTFVNSLRPSDAIWRQWSWTTLAQVMACCLTAPSHYLNQCWLIIRGVLWHTSESSFAEIAQGIDSGYEFEKDILKNIFKSPRGQWVLIEQHSKHYHCFIGSNQFRKKHKKWFGIPINKICTPLKSMTYVTTNTTRNIYGV